MYMFTKLSTTLDSLSIISQVYIHTVGWLVKGGGENLPSNYTLPQWTHWCLKMTQKVIKLLDDVRSYNLSKSSRSFTA